MKELLKQILEEMKSKVVENLDVVKDYDGDIKELLTKPESYARAFNLQMKRSRSRHILNDNLDYLELQLKLIQFIDKYRNEEFMKVQLPPVIIKGVDYYKETVEGRMEFNEKHPYYRDDKFIDRLMQHYLSEENYAKCDELTKIKMQENNR